MTTSFVNTLQSIWKVIFPYGLLVLLDKTALQGNIFFKSELKIPSKLLSTMAKSNHQAGFVEFRICGLALIFALIEMKDGGSYRKKSASRRLVFAERKS